MKQSLQSFTERLIGPNGENKEGITLTVGKTYFVAAQNSEGGPTLSCTSKLVSITKGYDGEEDSDADPESQLDYEFTFENGVLMEEIGGLTIMEVV